MIKNIDGDFLRGHLFLLKERIEQKKHYSLLSCADVVAYFMPSRKMETEEVPRQMQVRHKKRQAITYQPCYDTTPHGEVMEVSVYV